MKRLIVFVKNPVAGKVKTRLAKDIGDQNALKVYHALLAITLNAIQELDAEVAIYSNEPIDDLSLFSAYPTSIQKGKNLGERMHNAFKDGLQKGCQKQILIGSDLPEINDDILNKAFLSLNKYDVVIGPAHDGGYYLIGLNSVPFGIFENISWSTNTVFQQTLNKVSTLNTCILAPKSDIDTFKDLQNFKHLLNTVYD